MSKEEIFDGYDEHLIAGGAGDRSDVHDRADQEATGGIPFMDNFGEFAQDLDFSDLLLEEGIFGASAVDEASLDAAINGLKKSQRRGLTKKQAQHHGIQGFRCLLNVKGHASFL